MAGTDDSDVVLVARIGEGDIGALRELHHRHAPWLRTRLSQRCPDPDLVDEAVQETFLAVWKGAARFEPRAAVGAWVWGIGLRRLISALRRPANRWVPRLPWSVQQVEPSAEDSALLAVHHGRPGRALEQLSPELQAVVQAMVLDGLTAKETSRLLDIPVGTVKTRLMRAKSYLREQLI